MNSADANPFRARGRWFRGALHVHTTASDGKYSAAEAAKAYREMGYDFLAITDHRVVARLPEPPEGMLLVSGVEVHTWTADPERHWHLVSLGTTGKIPGSEGPLDALLEQVRANSAFWYLAHPSWSGLAEDDALDLVDLPAFEILNGGSEVEINRGDSEPVWDRLLSAGRRVGALGVDDSHSTSQFGLAWTMARLETLTLDALFDALRRRFYYASEGPEIIDFGLDGTTVGLRCSPARSISFLADPPLGKKVEAAPGGLLESASCELTGRETWVRAQVEDALGRRAFTNPLFFQR